MPIWWHNHGWKLQIKDFFKEQLLILKSNAALLRITNGQVGIPQIKGWIVEWEVVWCYPVEELARGRRIFSTQDLKAAFGLDINPHTFGQQHILDEFGGTCANQGLYIRWDKYLNIPGPGTGHDGDANISIEITREIKEAIWTLLKHPSGE